METREAYMTVTEYAKLQGVSVQSVYQKIKRKKLEHKKLGSFTLVKTS